MMIRTSFVFALALPLLAQPVFAQEHGAIEAGSVASFYKAYFLDKEGAKSKQSTAKAIELYTAFIAKNGEHKLAGRAAANCVVLLYSNGKIKAAKAFAKQHGSLMADAEANSSAAGGVMSMFGRRGGQQAENPNQEMVDKLMALHESAGEAEKARLGGAIARLGGARDLMMARFRGGGGRGGFGGRSGGRGGRGARFSKPKIAEMSQEDAVKAVETMATSLERMIDSMAQRGQADQADALEQKLDKIQDLVDDGKLKEAQKIIDAIEVGGSGRGGQNRRRRGGDAGGEQGGRRRRGGDAGGEQGGRRRRGGDTGAGGDQDRRRRRR